MVTDKPSIEVSMTKSLEAIARKSTERDELMLILREYLCKTRQTEIIFHEKIYMVYNILSGVELFRHVSLARALDWALGQPPKIDERETPWTFSQKWSPEDQRDLPKPAQVDMIR